ncbi:hypothetical protein ACFSPU_05265 [Haoranjiania flava]|uniref:SRPBCC family protein n=1 Tax=Haoranjiania flava TaxID=1856322 RepID=A0AAE3INW3_9BACT|nr:hypothetical protein [Haoranjiania flava]MCU7693736.1 hypothetical protein [Haoranjiania flava]
MRLESKDNVVNKPVSELFSFVENPEKIRSVMPDNVNKFEATADGFIFGIQGVPVDIKLKIKEKVANEKVVLVSANPNLDFTLSIFMQGLNAQQTMMNMVFEGEFNPMIKMMIQKPLQKFLNDFSGKAKLLQ